MAAAKRLGVDQPSLGVFGINPHAGEDGLFGDDDERITKPAVARLQALGIAADGPVGADLLLSQRRHDVYLAMFHDQGHIPIKLLSPLRASALTIGVPVLFAAWRTAAPSTSPARAWPTSDRSSMRDRWSCWRRDKSYL